MFTRSKKEFLDREPEPLNILALCAGIGLLIGLAAGWLSGHVAVGIALGAGGGMLVGWVIDLWQKRQG